VTGDEELVQDYVPASLNRIREAAIQSVTLLKAVAFQFEQKIKNKQKPNKRRRRHKN
jgi:hypothetical protein